MPPQVSDQQSCGAEPLHIASPLRQSASLRLRFTATGIAVAAMRGARLGLYGVELAAEPHRVRLFRTAWHPSCDRRQAKRIRGKRDQLAVRLRRVMALAQPKAELKRVGLRGMMDSAFRQR